MEYAGKTSASIEAGIGRRCYEAGNVLIDIIESLVTDKARDGLVGLDDVQRILRQLKLGTAQLDRAFEAQERRCRQKLWKRGDASIRSNPFKRLMVRPFETLMSGEAPTYPRAFLPNYLVVIDAAFGEKLPEYDRQCKAVFQALMVRHGSNLCWEDFYSDGRTWRILDKALRRLMGFLESPSGQWAWLQAMSKEASGGRRLSKEQAEIVLDTLRATLQGLMLEGAGEQGARCSA